MKKAYKLLILLLLLTTSIVFGITYTEARVCFIVGGCGKGAKNIEDNKSTAITAMDCKKAGYTQKLEADRMCVGNKCVSNGVTYCRYAVCASRFGYLDNTDKNKFLLSALETNLPAVRSYLPQVCGENAVGGGDSCTDRFKVVLPETEDNTEKSALDTLREKENVANRKEQDVSITRYTECTCDTNKYKYPLAQFGKAFQESRAGKKCVGSNGTHYDAVTCKEGWILRDKDKTFRGCPIGGRYHIEEETLVDATCYRCVQDPVTCPTGMFETARECQNSIARGSKEFCKLVVVNNRSCYEKARASCADLAAEENGGGEPGGFYYYGRYYGPLITPRPRVQYFDSLEECMSGAVNGEACFTRRVRSDTYYGARDGLLCFYRTGGSTPTPDPIDPGKCSDHGRYSSLNECLNTMKKQNRDIRELLKNADKRKALTHFSKADLIKPFSKDELITRLDKTAVFERMDKGLLLDRVEKTDIVKAFDKDDLVAPFAKDEIVSRLGETAVAARLETSTALPAAAKAKMRAAGAVAMQAESPALKIASLDKAELVTAFTKEEVANRFSKEDLVSRLGEDKVLPRLDKNTVLNRFDKADFVKVFDKDELINRLSADVLFERLNQADLVKAIDKDNMADRYTCKRVQIRDLFCYERTLKTCADLAAEVDDDDDEEPVIYYYGYYGRRTPIAAKKFKAPIRYFETAAECSAAGRGKCAPKVMWTESYYGAHDGKVCYYKETRGIIDRVGDKITDFIGGIFGRGDSDKAVKADRIDRGDIAATSVAAKDFKVIDEVKGATAVEAVSANRLGIDNVVATPAKDFKAATEVKGAAALETMSAKAMVK